MVTRYTVVMYCNVTEYSLPIYLFFALQKTEMQWLYVIVIMKF